MGIPQEQLKALSSVDSDQFRKAAGAILKHVKKKQTESRQALFDDDGKIWLDITFKSIPDMNYSRASPISLPLVHPIYGKDSEICLFVQGGPKDNMKKRFKDALVPQTVQKVVTDNSLTRKFKDHSSRWELMKSFDLFLVSDSLVATLPHLLGKTFLKSRRYPMVVKLPKNDKNSWVKKVTDMRLCTPWHPAPKKKTSVWIGATSFTQDQVLENCFTALNGIVSKLPNGLDTILMICMRGPGMPVLPVYQTLPHPPGASDVSKGSKGEIVSKIETGVCTRDRRTMEGSNNRPQDEEEIIQNEQADAILSSILEASIWQIGLKRKQVSSKSAESKKAKKAKKPKKEITNKVD